MKTLALLLQQQILRLQYAKEKVKKVTNYRPQEKYKAGNGGTFVIKNGLWMILISRYKWKRKCLI